MIINGDDFRFLHPDFNYIYQNYGDDFVTHTAKFSGETVERAIERAIVSKLNIVVEGTFRNAATPLQTLKKCPLPILPMPTIPNLILLILCTYLS